MNRKQLKRCFAAGVVALLANASANAGTFSANFNNLQFDPNDSGNDPVLPNNSFLPPAGMLWGGSLRGGINTGYDLRSGGVSGSGVLKLVNAVGNQNSSAVVGPIDMVDDGTGNLVPAKFIGFDMTFQLLLGGGAADGFSVAVGDFPFDPGTDPNTGEPAPNNSGVGQLFGEEGPGNMRGLTVTFDIFNNSPAGTFAEAPAIDLKWNGVTIAHRPANPAIGALPTNLQSGTALWPVKIHLDPDGTVDVIVNNVTVFGNYPIWRDIPDPVNGLRFGFGARTGGSNVNAWMDDLNITTTVDSTPPNPAVGQPYLVTMVPAVPVDQPYSALGGVSYLIQDSTYTITPSTIKLLFDTTDVTSQAIVTRVKSDPGLADPDQTLITYRGQNGVLPSGAHTATLSYATTSTPVANNSFVNTFTLSGITTIPASYKLTAVDETKPGFKARLYQMDRWRSPGDQNITPVGERQLAFGFIDPTTHQPYPDVSNVDPTTLDELGYFGLPDVLNFEQSGGNAGQVNGNSNPSRQESQFPGIPGNSTLDSPVGTGNFAMEFQGYLKLKAGGYRFGIFADDRVRFSFGPSFDAVGFAPQARTTGANADTIFDVNIAEDGFYPFRCSYWEGGGGANFELYWINPADNQKVLVNDPEVLEAPRVFQESADTRPWVKRVLPTEDWVGAFPNEKVLAEIINGPTIAIDDSSVKMQVNGVDQTITKTRTGRSLLVERPGSDTDLLPSGGNTVRIIYSYSENSVTVTKTNQYTFQVAPYYNAVPVAYKVPVTDINTADTGFNVRWAQMDRLLKNPNDQGSQGRIGAGGDGNRMPNPEIQLNNGEIDAFTGQPFPNIADPGPNGNFTDVLDLINFNDVFTAASGAYTFPNSGMFQSGAPADPLPGGNKPEAAAPGLPSPSFDFTRGLAAGNQNPSNGGIDNYVAEFTMYLDLKKGVHVFGMNSDDGFVFSTAPDPKDSFGTLLGFFNGGRGNKTIITDTEYQPWQNTATTLTPPVIAPGQESGSSLFSVVVPEDGIYPFRLLYWNGGGGINAEFYTVDQESGTYVLVNDLGAVWGDGTPASNIVPSYRTYTGPTREYVKFSISPNPWDNRTQQTAPGPITLLSHVTGAGTTTLNNAQSADIYNWAEPVVTGAPTNAPNWADVVIGAVVANAAPGGAADASLKLLLDGVEVPATKTVNGTDVKIAYKPNPILPPNSAHTATLVYGGASPSWNFRVQNYTTINAADKAASPGDPTKRGFSVKIAQSSAARTGGNTAAAAEAQVTGFSGQADVSVPGPENGRYIVPGIINFSNNNNNNPTAANAVQIGNFERNIYGAGWPFPEFIDQPVPGLTGNGTGAAATREQFTAEIFAWLEFPAAGYYRFGGNVDDGMVVKIGTPGVTNGPVLFTQDRGAGAADIPFSFVVPEAGLYPVRFVWYQGTGGGQAEFFTYDENGVKIPVNDPNNPNAIKAYYALQGGTGATLNVTVTGGNIVITWTGGGELETATDILGPWTGTGDTDGNFSTPLADVTGTKFFRVKN